MKKSELLDSTVVVFLDEVFLGSLTVWALYAYFSDSQNAAVELLVWRMWYQYNR